MARSIAYILESTNTVFLTCPGPIDYVDPWLSAYDERLRWLCAGRRRIAYFYELPDTSTFRYRAFNPGLTLGADPRWDTTASWFHHKDLAEDDRFISSADALVICRTRYNAAVARMVAKARAARIPVFFDCDDLVFDLGYIHDLIDANATDQHIEKTWDYWAAYIGRLGMVLRLCDRLVTTNDFLAGRARAGLPGLKTSVMPNYLYKDQQELSETIYRDKKQGGWRRDGRIHIGYFSGSPSHARDFAVAADAIARLMDHDPRVVLRIVGFLTLGSSLARHRDRIEIFPLQDFLNLQRLVAEVEINIAPLHDNIFTNCKSELKFFEAAICGTLTLASPTFAFRQSIDHGRTGFLVPPHKWDAALQEAVAIVDDRKRYAALAEAAFDHVRATYGWRHQGEKIVQAIFGAERQ